MNGPQLPRLAQQLQAYHDGELSRLARWRFERRLRRSPELRRELQELSAVGAWLRESHAEAASPDLWDAIAPRLPAADARRAEPAAVRREPGLRWLAWPAAAVASVLLAFFGTRWLAPTEPALSGGVVRWLDSGGRDVIVLEASPDTTIIWVIEGAPDAASRGTKGPGRDLV